MTPSSCSNWGFNGFESRVLFAESQMIAEARLFGGEGRSRCAASAGSDPDHDPAQCQRTDRRAESIRPGSGACQGGSENRQVGFFVATVVLETPLYAAETVETGSLHARAFDAAYELFGGRVPLRHRFERDSIPPWSFAALRGRFITFEGGEGSGKSTQAKRPPERLKPLASMRLLTREPGGSPGAEAIRLLFLNGVAKPLGPDAETLIFAAARDDHVSSHRASLERGLG